MALVYASSGANRGLGLFERFFGAAVVGLVAYITVVVLAQRRVARRDEHRTRLD
jgi:hypothetical protein